MIDAPFGLRFVAVVLLLGLTSGVEYAVKGKAAVRWRASLLIVTLSAIGALLGGVIDVLTSSISPAYFAIGKGLGWSSDLTWRACGLGLQAGAAAGVVVGAVLAYVNYRATGPSLPLARMHRFALIPVAAALMGGVALGVLAAYVSPGVLVDLVRDRLPEGDEAAFVTVWCAHIGLYAGALLGLGVAATCAWRARKVLLSKTG